MSERRWHNEILHNITYIDDVQILDMNFPPDDRIPNRMEISSLSVWCQHPRMLAHFHADRRDRAKLPATSFFLSSISRFFAFHWQRYNNFCIALALALVNTTILQWMEATEEWEKTLTRFCVEIMRICYI